MSDIKNPFQVTGERLPRYVAGDITVGTSKNGSTGSISYVKVAEFYIPRSGVLRTLMGLWRSGGLGVEAATGKVYINDVAVGTQRSTTNQTEQSYTEDFSVNAGDFVQLYALISAATASCGWRFQMRTNTTALLEVA